MNPSITPNNQNQSSTYNGINSNTASLLSQLDPNSNFSKTYKTAQDLSQNPQTQGDSSSSMPSQPQETGNWFTHLLPTITSIGGGLLGTLADPFTAGLGTIAGGAGGAALGKSWENALEGKDTTVQDLGGEALGGAIGGGIGKGIGLLGKGFGGLIAGQAEKGIAGATQAGVDAGTLSSAKNVTSLFGKDAANGIDQNFNKAFDFTSGKNGIGQDITNDPATAKANIDAMITHFGNARQEALQNSGNVQLAGQLDANGNQVAPSIQDVLMNSFNKTTDNGTTTNLGDQLGGFGSKTSAQGDDNTASRFVASLSPGSASTPATDLLGQVKTAVSPLFKAGGLDSVGNVPATTVQDSLTAVNNLRSSAYNALQKAGSDASTAENVPALQAKLDYITNVKTGIEGMLYNRPEFTNALGESVGKQGGMLDNLRALGPQGEAMAARSEQVNPITGGKDFNQNFSDLLNTQRVLDPAAAKFSSPTSDYARLQATPTATSVDSSGNPVSDLLSVVPHAKVQALNMLMNAGNNGGAVGEAKQGFGSLLQRMSSAGSLAGKAGSPLKGVGTQTGILPIMAGQIPAGAAMAGAQPSDQPQSYLTGGAGGNPMQPNQTPMNSPLQQGLQLGLDGMSDPYHASAYAPLVQQLIGQAQQAHTANATLQSLENSYKTAGGGQGLAGGLFSKIGGALTGNNVASYDAQRQQAMGLLQSLGIPLSAIPDVTSTVPAAQGQFQNAQSIINSLYGGR